MRHLRLLVAVLFCSAVASTLEAQTLDRLPAGAALPAHTSTPERAYTSPVALRSALRRAAADDSVSEYHWERYALVGAVVGGVASAALVASNSSLPGCGANGSPGFCAGARILVVGAGVGIGAFGGWLAARLTR